jgi:UDP-3-O-[3-hydroxymyristoyl] glucosamine N-acyltransferase
LSDTRCRSALAETGAAAVILKAEDADQYDGNKLITSNPQVLFTKIATLLHPYPKHPAAIDPDAKIAANVVPGDTVYIGANTVISTGCRLGQRVQVGANCFIGAGVEIGDDCVIHPGVCIHDKTRIGRDCIIQSGVVIGSDGFGLANDRGEWLRMPQIGRVIVGNNVDIGANSTIDRGSMDDTVLGNGVKLDNQVQIAHNVKVGDHTAMASFVGIAGSTRIGKRCMLGGRCNINGHIDIVDDVVVFADSFISHSILETGTYSSVIVARKVSKWRRIQGRLQQLDEFAKRLRRLEHKVNKQGRSIS